MKQVNLSTFKLVGISKMTSNQEGKALRDINNLWSEFLGQNLLEQIPNKISNDIYSLYTDYEGDHNQPYRVILGCKVSNLHDVPEGMDGREFSGGRYELLTTEGNLSEGIVVKKWQEIWQSDLNRAYTADFEVYGESAKDPQNAKINFYIAIK